jgi:AcrR family transcriptional regulator
MPPRMKAPARRLQLLETAARCFAEHGYRGTTTAMLAKAAGISEPILYRHFANKQDLFVALIESLGHRVFAEWQRLTKPLGTPTEKLRAIFHRNPATADPETGIVYRIIFHAVTETAEPQIQQAIREHFDRHVKFLSRLVREAQEAGDVRTEVAADVLAWQILHAGIGFAMMRMLGMPSHDRPAFVHEIVGLIDESLRRPGGKPAD